MWYILGFLWWLSGALAHGWITRDGIFTWGDAAGCVLMGLLGPIYALTIIVIVGGDMLWSADFWDKPMFGKKHKSIKYHWDN